MDKSEEDNIKHAKFCFETLQKSLQGVNASLPDIDPVPYCDTMIEFVKIFNQMGSALSIAFQDITSKVAIIKRNRKIFPDVQGGIISFIEFEATKKLQRLNGENAKKESPGPEWNKYEATSRTVLRLMWFFDFVSVLLGNLHEDRKTSLTSACKDAYDQALGPHHPFPVRAGAKLAMLAAPKRSKLLGGLFGEHTSDEQIYANIKVILDLVDPVRKSLWKYYEEKELTKLP